MNATLEDLKYIIIDEVHERSTEIDMILLFLKEMLMSQKIKCPKIILMSATADAALFQSYFKKQVI